jgi:hypothetical protein
MTGSTRCPCCGYHVAVTSSPYGDPAGELIESLIREVEHLRLVVSNRWGSGVDTIAPAAELRLDQGRGA